MRAAAAASTSGAVASQPPKARICMNNRRSLFCGSPFFMPPFSLRSGGSGPLLVAVGDAMWVSIIRRLATYHLRRGTLADADAIVHHRIAMFTDMGLALDEPTLDREFRAWLTPMMANGTYHSWMVETDAGEIVAGG